jgi:DNA-binding transcriptional ArsR family regulator
MSYQNADVTVPKCVYVRYPLMSPNTNSKISWDPSLLLLNQNRVTRSQGIVRHGRRTSPIQGRFIAGPIDVSWVVQASRLGVKALVVGLALWHIKGLRKADIFFVSNLMMQDWGVQPDAKGRALRALENAGLIKVERRGKRSPQVTLVVEEKGSASP